MFNLALCSQSYMLIIFHYILVIFSVARAPGVPWCRVSSLEMLNSLLDDMPGDAENLGVVHEKGEY